MITLRQTVQGVPETLSVLARGQRMLQRDLETAVHEGLKRVAEHTQRSYLSGPRPAKLGVITGRLRRSFTEGSSDHIVRIRQMAGAVEGTLGSRVPYAIYAKPRAVPSSGRLPRWNFLFLAAKDRERDVTTLMAQTIQQSETRIQTLLS